MKTQRFLLLALFLLFAGCGSNNVPTITVQELVANNLAYNGQKVRVQGFYSWDRPEPKLKEWSVPPTLDRQPASITFSPDVTALREGDADKVELVGVFDATNNRLLVSDAKILTKLPPVHYDGAGASLPTETK